MSFSFVTSVLAAFATAPFADTAQVRVYHFAAQWDATCLLCGRHATTASVRPATSAYHTPFNSRFSTFPVALIGSESLNSTTRGYLYEANCSRAQSTSISSVMLAPGLRTM